MSGEVLMVDVGKCRHHCHHTNGISKKDFLELLEDSEDADPLEVRGAGFPAAPAHGYWVRHRPVHWHGLCVRPSGDSPQVPLEVRRRTVTQRRSVATGLYPQTVISYGRLLWPEAAVMSGFIACYCQL